MAASFLTDHLLFLRQYIWYRWAFSSYKDCHLWFNVLNIRLRWRYIWKFRLWKCVPICCCLFSFLMVCLKSSSFFFYFFINLLILHPNHGLPCLHPSPILLCNHSERGMPPMANLVFNRHFTEFGVSWWRLSTLIVSIPLKSVLNRIGNTPMLHVCLVYVKQHFCSCCCINSVVKSWLAVW